MPSISVTYKSPSWFIQTSHLLLTKSKCMPHIRSEILHWWWHHLVLNPSVSVRKKPENRGRCFHKMNRCVPESQMPIFVDAAKNREFKKKETWCWYVDVAIILDINNCSSACLDYTCVYVIRKKEWEYYSSGQRFSISHKGPKQKQKEYLGA